MMDTALFICVGAVVFLWVVWVIQYAAGDLNPESRAARVISAVVTLLLVLAVIVFFFRGSRLTGCSHLPITKVDSIKTEWVADGVFVSCPHDPDVWTFVPRQGGQDQ